MASWRPASRVCGKLRRCRVSWWCWECPEQWHLSADPSERPQSPSANENFQTNEILGFYNNAMCKWWFRWCDKKESERGTVQCTGRICTFLFYVLAVFLEIEVNLPTKSNHQKEVRKFSYFLPSLKPLKKGVGSKSWSLPNPLQTRNTSVDEEMYTLEHNKDKD